MYERINQTIVPHEYDRARLDLYLAQRFTYLSRAEWQKEIACGKIFINEEPVKNSHRKIKAGELVRYDGPGILEPGVDSDVGILYEDDALICINKNGNLPVHPSGRYFNNTLLRIMEKRLCIKLYPVHRLDKETSGVILFAKRADITSKIQKDFFRIKKSYIAIVYGAFPEKEFMVDVPIGYDPASTVKKMRIASPEAKESARTRFKRIFSFGNYSLIKAFPETGRLHQIRVHLKHAGYPILGDKMYGLDPDYFLRFIREGMSAGLLEELEFPRSALHSRSLCFYHPEMKKELLVKAPVPGDFKTFIQSRRIAPCLKR